MKKASLLSFKKHCIPFMPLPMYFSQNSSSQKSFETDSYPTSMGELKMTFIGHGSLMFEINNLVIHIDPVMAEADYSKLPKADIIFVTHNHYDHMDMVAISHIQKQDSTIVFTERCENDVNTIKNQISLKNGENTSIENINIEAVPAYNLVHMSAPGEPYHPKGEGNGYIFSFGDKKIYVAGDTEDIPEMKNIKNIDVAFLPMNLPFTMTPKMVAKATKMFRPKILYPYHYGDTNPNDLVDLLKEEKDIEIRIRELQ